jgi:WD40 repeat protein
MPHAGHNAPVYGVCVSKDSQKIITCSHDETIREWNIMKGHLEKTVKAHTSTIYACVLSPNGKYLATASADKTVKVGGQAALRPGGPEGARRKHARACFDACLRAATHSQQQQGATHVLSPAGCPLQLWALSTGELKDTLIGHTSHVVGLAFTPDGSKLVSAAWDETLKAWDVESGEVLHTFTGHQGKVHCVCCAPDGDTIISGGEDKCIKLWRISTGACFHTIPSDPYGKSSHADEILAVAIAPDQSLMASGGADNCIRTWKVIGL